MKTYRINIKGKDYEVVVGDLSASPVTVTVDGEEFQVDLPGAAGQAPATSPTAAPSPAPRPSPSMPASPPRPTAPASGGDGSIRALMPGRIVSVSVTVGQQVKSGDPVLVMESMKMENTISAPADGTVTAILVEEGDSVQHGQTMIEIDG